MTGGAHSGLPSRALRRAARRRANRGGSLPPAAALPLLPMVPSRERGALAALLINRAVWVHERIAAAEQASVRLDEDTLTQDLLLDMRLAYPALRVIPFNRREEGRNGADWEWWIEGRRHWFGFRVQAKRLHPVAGSAHGYDFAYQSRRAPRRQIDLLIESSRMRQIPAIYALYNGPQLDVRHLPWLCDALPPMQRLAGVTTIAAPVARALLDSGRASTVTDVWTRTRPWSCLATCDPGFGLCQRLPWWPWRPDSPVYRYLRRPGDENDPAVRAAGFVYELHRYARRDVDDAEDRVARTRLLALDRDLDVEETAGRLRWLFPDPPPYVTRALDAGVAAGLPDDPAQPDQLVVMPYAPAGG
ncbi:MAG TPA: hypothetical protein VFQ85_12970 [Mycobacteriales bacterium]|nr:hypothetical protein [Mycobacteriales bacterium]